MSSEYYRTPEGRAKKQNLNAKRGSKDEASPSPEDGLSQAQGQGQGQEPEDGPESGEDGLVSYLQELLGQVEGRKLSREEVRAHQERWNQELRQYGLARDGKTRTLPDD